MSFGYLPLGKLPAQPARPQLRAAAFLDTRQLPAPPPSADWLTEIPSWPMYGNDELGDCVFAEIGHHEQQISLLGQGVEARVTDRDVIAGYSQVTGFNPGDPSTDQGTYMQDAMAWWRKTGIAGHQIIAYASVDPADLTLVKQAIHLFGAVSIGFNFPRSAWTQFDNSQPWDVVPGSPLEGGHCVMTGAYDDTGLTSVTWGATQKMTYGFWRTYVDEAWVVIDDEMADRLTGMAFSGVDLYTLGSDFTELTGEPNPVPVPAPVPIPAEPVTAADRALWDGDVGQWARKDSRLYRKVRAGIRAWAGTKGLS